MVAVKSEDLKVMGYYPGVVGKIIQLHAVYYHENWGFDVSFETQEGKELSEFMREYKEGRDGFWVAQMHETFAGSIAIDGRDVETEGARLRWLIVEPRFHGQGIGTLLIREAVQFCKEADYRLVYLWTFEGLHTARHIYEKEGFHLAKERRLEQWGQDINEQMFELHLKAEQMNKSI
jgi:GNAT superfamily N-acetyltransferase